jgi:serine kinase of HPr protein (carbohydrate metabolism regulator)
VTATEPSIHASAVLVGSQAVLIRGPSGSGKSRLAFDLMLAGRSGTIAPTALIGDDRILLSQRAGQLVAQPVPALAGLIEIRGLGIRRCEAADGGAVSLVVDLAATDAARMPALEALHTVIQGVSLARLPVGSGYDALALVLGALTTVAAASANTPQVDCGKHIYNHIRPTLTPPTSSRP